MLCIYTVHGFARKRGNRVENCPAQHGRHGNERLLPRNPCQQPKADAQAKSRDGPSAWQREPTPLPGFLVAQHRDRGAGGRIIQHASQRPQLRKLPEASGERGAERYGCK